MPSLGMMTINTLVSADKALIPVQALISPMKGLQQLIRTIGKVHRQLNPSLEILGIILTMVDCRTNYAKGKWNRGDEKHHKYLTGIILPLTPQICVFLFQTGDEEEQSRYKKIDVTSKNVQYINSLIKKNSIESFVFNEEIVGNIFTDELDVEEWKSSLRSAGIVPKE